MSSSIKLTFPYRQFREAAENQFESNILELYKQLFSFSQPKTFIGRPLEVGMKRKLALHWRY